MQLQCEQVVVVEKISEHVQVNAGEGFEVVSGESYFGSFENYAISSNVVIVTTSDHSKSDMRKVGILPQTDFWGLKFPQNSDHLKNIRYLLIVLIIIT